MGVHDVRGERLLLWFITPIITNIQDNTDIIVIVIFIKKSVKIMIICLCVYLCLFVFDFALLTFEKMA